MRLCSLALPAAFFATAGLGLAQNAISLWKSNTGNAGLTALGVGGVTGQAGNKLFHTLPADVLTYFRPNLGARELDFIGFETLWQAGGTINNNLPGLDLQLAVENPADPNRLLPSEAVGPATTFLSIPSGVINIGVIPAGQRVHIAVTTPGVPVPAGDATGRGLAAVCQNYQQQAGAASLLALFTMTPGFVGLETYTDQTDCLSGVKFATNPTWFYLTQLFVIGAVSDTEWAITYLFKQSMIQPVKNVAQTTSGTPLPGGVNPPSGVFTFNMDNGAGALRPNSGDVVSYSGNSTLVAQGAANQPWFVPFTLFDGTAGTQIDPLPENWNNPSKSSTSWVHKMSVQKYIDDVITTFGGTLLVGAALAPSNPTQAVWFGVDSPAFINVNVLVDAFQFADMSGGPRFAGPSLPAFDSALQPGGIILRNGMFDGAKVAEHQTFLVPQNGFTVINPVGTNLGFAANPGGVLAGKAFWIQCWMLDVASTTTVTNYNLVDMSNAIKITLGL